MPDPENFIADMQGLKGDLDQLFHALDTDEPDNIAAAQADVLSALESCAMLHCGIVSKIIRDQRKLDRQMGLRQVSIPVDFSGNWLVLPSAARQAL